MTDRRVAIATLTILGLAAAVADLTLPQWSTDGRTIAAALDQGGVWLGSLAVMLLAGLRLTAAARTGR